MQVRRYDRACRLLWSLFSYSLARFEISRIKTKRFIPTSFIDFRVTLLLKSIMTNWSQQEVKYELLNNCNGAWFAYLSFRTRTESLTEVACANRPLTTDQ